MQPKKKFQGKRRRGGKRAPTTKSLAKKIKQIEYKEEAKHYDTYDAGTVVTVAAPATYNIGTMSLGNTDSTRVGFAVSASSVQVRMQLKTNAVNASSIRIRVMLIWDSQPNGASAASAVILDNSVITDLTFAPHNYDFIKRFKFLHDRVYNITPNIQAQSSITNNLTATATDTLASVNVVSKSIQIFKKLNRQIKYHANGGTVADIQTNNLFLLVLSDQAANGPTIELGIRLYYKDD